MGIGIYTGETGSEPTKSVFNRLIINQLIEEVGSGKVAFIQPGGKNPVPDDLQGIPVHQVRTMVRGAAGRYFLKKKLAAIAKQEGMQGLVVFHTDHVITAAIPQVLVLPDEYKIREKDKTVLQRAAVVVLRSERLQRQIEARIGPGKVRLLRKERLLQRGLASPGLLRSRAFKERMTEGKEFLICNDEHWSPDRLVLLLKAFSRFKKMQEANWKLIITQRGYAPQTAFEKVFAILDTYRYRDDVVLFQADTINSYSDALGAAYACITVARNTDAFENVYEALLCATPVLAPADAGEGALPGVHRYLEADEASLGIKIMELYKNEALRQQYITAIREGASLLQAGDGLSDLVDRLLHA